MSREVLLSVRAEDEFQALDRRIRDRVRAALTLFAETGRGDLKKLKGVHGGPDLFRLRVGQFRVIFQVTPTQLRVTRIIPRSEGYDWL